MELDKRIKALTDIQSVTSILNNRDLDKKGYFADHIAEFKDLSKCMYGEFVEYREHEQCFLCEIDHYDGTFDHTYYRYFIPEDSLLPKVKPEKKYRAFTLTEWINQYEIGQIIHYRSKSEEVEAHIMYMGTYHHKNKGTIVLGVASYTLDCLFEEYELEIDGEWMPFGIEVKDEE